MTNRVGVDYSSYLTGKLVNEYNLGCLQCTSALRSSTLYFKINKQLTKPEVFNIGRSWCKEKLFLEITEGGYQTPNLTFFRNQA